MNSSTDVPRIRDVYRQYELGRISFQDVIAASERIIAATATAETGSADAPDSNRRFR
jgi:hypothetical protein